METELQLATGYIETFAGNGKARSTGDGKRAVKSGIPLPHHAALDKDETWFYFAESGSDRIRRVNLREGTLHNFAGIGETCYSGDEGPCGDAGLYLPLDVAFDSRNDLYICDSGSNRIRKVDHETGIITTIIGTGQHGFNGDGPALEVNLTWPAAIAFDPNDVMYIADTQAHRIRRYDPKSGTISRVAGTGRKGTVGLGGDPLQCELNRPHGVTIAPDGSLYITDSYNDRILRIAPPK